MTKLLVFDSVNLQTALLARQILDTNENVWIFMNGDIPQNNQPIMFKDDDNISWLLNFCDINAAVLHDRDGSDIYVCIPDINVSALIDRLLNKPNLSLTSDTPCTIDFKNKQVKVNDVVEYSYVPSGDVRSIFVSQPIDKFYDFKFGHVFYRKPTYKVDSKNRSLYKHATDVFFDCDSVNLYSAKINWFTDNQALLQEIYFDLTFATDDSCVVDDVTKDNVNLFNSYLTYNRLHKQIKYIGPSTVMQTPNPFYMDLNKLFNTISKI